VRAGAGPDDATAQAVGTGEATAVDRPPVPPQASPSQQARAAAERAAAERRATQQAFMERAHATRAARSAGPVTGPLPRLDAASTHERPAAHPGPGSAATASVPSGDGPNEQQAAPDQAAPDEAAADLTEDPADTTPDPQELDVLEPDVLEPDVTDRQIELRPSIWDALMRPR
jgi:hypothetical protein